MLYIIIRFERYRNPLMFCSVVPAPFSSASLALRAALAALTLCEGSHPDTVSACTRERFRLRRDPRERLEKKRERNLKKRLEREREGSERQVRVRERERELREKLEREMLTFYCFLTVL